MMICYSPITTCARNVFHIKSHLGTHLQGPYKLYRYSLFSGLSRRDYAGFGVSTGGLKEQHEVSFLSPDAKRKCSQIKSNMRNLYRYSRFAYTAVVCSLLVCYSSTSQSACADASRDSHVKRVYTDYSIIGIPGDGRCLFRSVAYGFCLCSGKMAPSEKKQRELADELRTWVADKFIERRQETEWFVKGDFDTYVKKIREPHVWGGEPELFMASHVLKMPITVYMKDEKVGGLICIAEYGQEYGKKVPIRVLYHGFGHYDALLIHESNDASIPKSKH